MQTYRADPAPPAEPPLPSEPLCRTLQALGLMAGEGRDGEGICCPPSVREEIGYLTDGQIEALVECLSHTH
jgi:hypothetical protein